MGVRKALAKEGTESWAESRLSQQVYWQKWHTRLLGSGQFPDNNHHRAVKMRDHKECTGKPQREGKEEGGKEGKKEAKGGKECGSGEESHLKKVRFLDINYQESLCLQTVESI